jgi:deoxyribodipyrimidine photolyase-related protein
MINNIFLIFPIHLFKNITLLKNKKVYLIEEPRFFTDFKYHKLKIAYHRASMKSYYDYLISNNISVKYIESNEYNNINDLYKELNKQFNKGNKLIETYSIGDNVLEKKLLKYIPKLFINQTLNFLVDKDLINDNLSIFYKNNKFNHQEFYKWQRIRLNILVTKDNKPIGGKWSFDEDNRKKMPSNIKVPNIEKNTNQKNTDQNKYIKEAIQYTNKNFPNNYGSLDNFIYPIDHKEANIWLKDFIKYRLTNFGTYEDAVDEKYPFLFHSVLSPMMNIGLLTDKEVIEETLKHKQKIPINSLEGFIRQIIGWRNYVYTVYSLVGDKLKKSNFMKHKNKINSKFYKKLWIGATNITPIDDIIHKIVEYAYAHHIERLMYLGNYLLLCMINPNDIYRMFMEWTIDAYEWVMIPNVYGMSQYADGGMMMTRPYFASSNYILKMSNYKKDDWCIIFDSLYYNFINKHQKILKKNYSTAIQVSYWNKKTDKEKKDIIHRAKIYYNSMNL